MNTFTLTNLITERLTGPVLTMATLVGLTTPALGCDELTSPAIFDAESRAIVTQVSGDGKLRLELSQVVSDDGKQQLELSVRDGNIRVVINGEEIPAERLKQEGDQIIVLDEDGKELSRLNFQIQGGPGAFSYVLGDDAKRWQELAGRLRGAYAAPIAVAAATPAKVMLGVTMIEPGAALERQLKLEPGATTMLSGVYEGLPAHQAGLAEYDIITEVNGQAPSDPTTIRKLLAEAEPGQVLKFTVISNGQKKPIQLQLAAFDKEQMSKARLHGSGTITEGLPGVPGVPGLPGVGLAPLEIPGMAAPDRQWLVTPDAQTFRIPSGQRQRALIEAEAAVQKRLEQVDERLRRVEELLEKLAADAEKKQSR